MPIRVRREQLGGKQFKETIEVVDTGYRSRWGRECNGVCMINFTRPHFSCWGGKCLMRRAWLGETDYTISFLMFRVNKNRHPLRRALQRYAATFLEWCLV